MSPEPGEKPDWTEDVVLTPVADDEPRGGVRLQHLMFLVGVCGFLAWMGRGAGLWLILCGIWLLVGAAAGLAVVLTRRRATQQESLLWGLAVAAERSMPLAPAALAFADQFSRSFRDRVVRLGWLLDQGTSLPEAFDRVPGLLWPEAEALVRAGWRSGTLARALRDAAALRADRQAVWGSLVGRLTYLLTACLSMQAVCAFILYFIAPKFEAIFKDFGTPLPAATVFTLRAGYLLTNTWGGLPLIALVLAELAALTVLATGIGVGFEGRAAVIDAFSRRRHTTLLLRALSLSAGGDKPLMGGLADLSREYPSGWVRWRLGQVVHEVKDGRDWVDSLLGQGLIRRADAAVIASAQRVGNLEWALREVADSNERRARYLVQFWLQTLFPVAVIGLGALVFLMAVAYFGPIVRLIEVLAQ